MSSKTQFDFSIRKDLLVFIDYVDSKGIKRSHRGNRIMKGDFKRLAKILTVPERLRDGEPEDGDWAHFICGLAYGLKLLTYDTEGVYAGWSSSEPSFPDNYIEINGAAVDRYMTLSSSDKEREILEVMLKEQSNEFYTPALLGRSLGRFDRRGSGVNIASKMNFTKIRRRLLEILAVSEPGQAIPFHELLQHIKKKEPNLILDSKFKPRIEIPPSSWSKDDPNQLYHCFYEGPKGTYDRIEIHESEVDSFKRVEGRYLAFFLEEIAHLMQFVQLEYDDDYECDVRPGLPDYIKSFTVTRKLAPILQSGSDALDTVKIRMTPDYKLFVEAELYPDKELGILEPFTRQESSGTHLTVLKLDRKKAVAELAENPDTPHVADILKGLDVTIPKNIAVELAEWSRSADKFVIYKNVGLLEFRNVNAKQQETVLDTLQNCLVGRGGDSFAIVTKPGNVYSKLRSMELLPNSVKHTNKRVHLATEAGSITKKAALAAPPLKKVILNESSFIALQTKDKKFAAQLKKGLQDLKVEPIITDTSLGYVIIPDSYRSKIHPLIRKLGKSFDIRIV